MSWLPNIYVGKTEVHVLLSPETSELAILVQKVLTNPFLPPLPSSIVVNASRTPHLCFTIYLHRATAASTVQLYALPSIDSIPNPSNHLMVGHPQIYSKFDVGESSAHFNTNVSTSSSLSITHKQLERHQQQITTIEATLEVTSILLVVVFMQLYRYIMRIQ